MQRKKSFKSLIQIVLISIFFAFIIFYAYSRTSLLSQGPSLSLKNLQNGQTISTRTLTLEGNAKRAIKLTLNNREILIDQDGNFKDLIILHPGLNLLVLEAKDKFNNHKQISYTVWHQSEISIETVLESYKNSKIHVQTKNTKPRMELEETLESPEEDKEDPIENEETLEEILLEGSISN